jgi:hypothetical protein
LTSKIIAAYTDCTMLAQIRTIGICQARPRTTRIRAVGGVCALAG